MNWFTGDFETDCMIMYMYVNDLNLFTTNNRSKYCKKGRPLSNVYGTTQFSYIATHGGRINRKPCPTGGYYTKLQALYPEYMDIFQEFVGTYVEDFEFNQIVINKNFEIMPHKDASNVGVSYIIGLGEYTNGDLVVDYEDYEERHNIRHKFYTFDGSKYTHWVEPFEGERFTLVFYNSGIKLKKNNIGRFHIETYDF
tara:strand:- start:68 stop:658 length:591 start_codon:yes stop_codon:yes gene_type:complete